MFTRFPRPGQTKTRLIPALGAERAAELQRCLTEHTLERLAPLLASGGPQLEIRFDPQQDAGRMRQWLCPPHHAPVEAFAQCLRAESPRVRLASQSEGDLGLRMLNAFEDAAREGSPAAAIIGTDTPALESSHLRQALDALQRTDVVLGPAVDGGYYLIGLARPQPPLFRDMPWGGAEVLETTLGRIERAGLSVELLDELSDVDRPEDLMLLRKFANLRQFAR